MGERRATEAHRLLRRDLLVTCTIPKYRPRLLVARCRTGGTPSRKIRGEDHEVRPPRRDHRSAREDLGRLDRRRALARIGYGTSGAGAFWDAIEAMGGPRRSPGDAVRSVEEAIEVMRLVWSEERNLRFDGEIYKDRKSTRLNSSHANISYAVFCL